MLSDAVMGQVFLKPKRAQPFYAQHPWVFAGAIERIEGEPADGAVVDLRSHVGHFIARGLFNRQSKIQVRLFAWKEDTTLNRDFFHARLKLAIALRHDVLKLNAGTAAAYRVVFSEADRLPGLIVDRYGDWLAVQFTSLALALRKEMFGELLTELLPCRGIFLKNERGINKLEGLALTDGLLCGELPPAEVIVKEHGLQYVVNLAEGQKTGFYLDQRENRTAVANFAAGKRVLDAFCYTGGFGLSCARAGATEVECVDSSEAALSTAIRNADLNDLPQVQFVKADVFDHLDELVASGRIFDVVVLDPPKFARDRNSLPQALRGYRRLIQQSLRLLTSGGILVKCCCTGLITMDMLEELIAQTANEAKREAQFLERRGPGADHPVSAACREGAYLKCIITRVV